MSDFNGPGRRITYPSGPTLGGFGPGAAADVRLPAVRRTGRARLGGSLAVLVAALVALACAPTGHAQGVDADTETLSEAHSKLSQEVNDTLVAVARATHPLSSKAMHLVEESGVTVDEAGRLRLAVTLNVPLDDLGQEQLEELGVEIQRMSSDKQRFRAWVPAEAVEDLASLKIVAHVAPG